MNLALAPRLAARVAAVALAALCWTAPLPAADDAGHGAVKPAAAFDPKIKPAGDEPTRAVKAFRLATPLRVDVWAAEPMLANPVAMAFDARGRLYVAETFRFGHGVPDTRGMQKWLDDDLACKTVADRVAMYRKWLDKNEFASYGVASERVQLLEDTKAAGRADRSTVFAEGFRNPADGVAAGVLVNRGDVYFACIPDLWRLRDTNGDGKADVRESLHNGYGVHVNFVGHDLHGLTLGPDGRLYFSIGDRALNVMTKEGTRLTHLDSGAVLRCELDGSRLELFATGLRNPQELAFDDTGDLFTGDNNSDSGDKARVVHVVEGGDSGWRIGYQWIERPVARGPWNSEKLWHTQWDGQAAYLVPPLWHGASGPSGLAREPGVSLLPEAYKHHFFLCDFHGSVSGSGVRSFAVEPKGASFAVVNEKEFVWNVAASDVDFGPDGALYISDWVEGWNIPMRGRVERLYDPNSPRQAAVAEVKTLLAEGMAARSADDLIRLLAHADRRVRQEAQFDLARRAGLEVDQPRGLPAPDTIKGTTFAKLAAAAYADGPTLPRLHAIWALGQIGRRSPQTLITRLTRLVDDKDAEVRAQTARMLGDLAHVLGGPAAAPASEIGAALRPMLADPSPRVRVETAVAIGKTGDAGATGPLLTMLRENNDRDPYLRHAAVLGLVGIGDVQGFAALSKDAHAAVRIGAVLALRRLSAPEVAQFLNDREPRVVLEAARAIYDVPIATALPKLAALARRRDKDKLDLALWRRILNASYRLGRPADPYVLSMVATRGDLPESIRVEAVEMLRDWARPPGRDRVNGLWRPIAPRDQATAVEAAKVVAYAVERDLPWRVARAAMQAVARLGIKELEPFVAEVARDAKQDASTRVAALKALQELRSSALAEAVRATLRDKEEPVRAESLRILATLSPSEALPVLGDTLSSGTIVEKQGALASLGSMKSPRATELIARSLDALTAATLPRELELDVLEAAAKHADHDASMRRRLAAIEAKRSKSDPLASYRAALFGGDATRGARVARENRAVECVRCHKVRGVGGVVGPELAGVGTRQNAEYVLESIVKPNAKIAKGYETQVVALADGRVVAGIVQKNDAKSLTLLTAEGKTVEVAKESIEEQKTGASSMPEDIASKLTKAEIRDLVAYLMSLKP